jgi:hypothetical protein
MRPLVFSAALLLMAAATASAQEPPAEAQAPLAAAFRDSQQLAQCTRSLDAECVLALSDSNGYARVYGSDFKLTRAQSRLFAGMKQKGYRFVAFSTGPPRELFIDGGRLYTFVPYTSTSDWAGQITTHHSYFVALSSDGGESWKFVAGGKEFSEEKLRLLIPSYAGQPLPPVSETVGAAP